MIPDAPFTSWCTSQGIKSPLELKGVGSGYRYLAAKNDISSEEALLSVPLDACVIDDTKEGLAERLYHERSLGSESKYDAYIGVLPDLDSFASMPRFWSPDRLARVSDFDGGQLEQRVATDAKKELDPWAYACVSSRSNFLNDFRYSLTPLLDMLNHDGTVGTSASISDEGELCLSVKEKAKAGDEVFISYGALSNIDTLCDYGFISSDNPCNTELMEIQMLGLDPVILPIYSDGSIDNGAIAMLRESLAASEERDEDRKRGGSAWLPFRKPLSDRLEYDVFSLVASSLDGCAEKGRLGEDGSREGGDEMAAEYLKGRVGVLEKGISKILERFPDLEY